MEAVIRFLESYPSLWIQIPVQTCLCRTGIFAPPHAKSFHMYISYLPLILAQLWNTMMGLLCERTNLSISSPLGRAVLVTDIQHATGLAICAFISELVSMLLFV